MPGPHHAVRPQYDETHAFICTIAAHVSRAYLGLLLRHRLGGLGLLLRDSHRRQQPLSQ